MFTQKGIHIAYLQKSKYDPTTLVSLLKLIKREHIDLIHAQGFGSMTFARMAKLLTGVPILVHFHDTGNYYPYVQKVSDLLLARFTDRAIAVSGRVKQHNIVHKRVIGLKKDKIFVRYNCIPTAEYQTMDTEMPEYLKKKWGCSPCPRIVGTVTRLFEAKGVRYFLDAAAMISNDYTDVRFIMVGDGPEREFLEAYTKSLGLSEKVFFSGFVQNIKPLLTILDYFVFTSHAGEGTPLSVLEAMAAGKPIICTNIIEIIENGHSGLLVPPKNASAIAQTLKSLLDHPDVASKLGKQARLFSKLFDVHTYVKNLEEIYRELALNGRKDAIRGFKVFNRVHHIDRAWSSTTGMH